MTNRNLSIDGEDFGLNFNPKFTPDVKTLDIEAIFKNKTTRSIAVGVLKEVEGVIGTLQNNYTKMTDPDNIEKLSDKKDDTKENALSDRELYGKYVKLVSEKVLQSTVSDLLKAFDDAGIRKRVFKKFPKGGILQNKSLETYLKDNDILIQDMSINFLRDASATREQQLSLTDDGTRLTRILLKPNKQNITKPSALIDMSMINESKFLSVREAGGKKLQRIMITFDSLQYMKELFEDYDYDEPFEFQEDTEKIKGTLGRFPSNDEELEGVALPSNRIIVTSISDDKKIKNSYIDGEGLDEKTTVTSRVKRQARDDEAKIPAYNYITISPSFDESAASKKERDFTITYVHRNENSIVKVTDNSESENMKKGEAEELLMFLQAYKVESGEITFDLYVNDGNASADSPVLQDLTYADLKDSVQEKDWITEYQYTGKVNPIDKIIASSLTPISKRMTEAGIVYDVSLPLGIIEIEVTSAIDSEFGKEGLLTRMIKIDTQDAPNLKLEEIIDTYEKYMGFVVPFHDAKTTSDDVVTFDRFSENAPGATPAIYNDLEEMYEGASNALMRSKNFYDVMLVLALSDITPEFLRKNITEDPEGKGIARFPVYRDTTNIVAQRKIGEINRVNRDAAVSLLYSLIPEDKKESGFASSKEYLTRDEEKTKRVSAYFDKGAGKIPLLKLKSATAKYKKQLLLTGPAGLPGIGGRTEIKEDLNTAKRVVRGIKSYSKSIDRAVEG